MLKSPNIRTKVPVLASLTHTSWDILYVGRKHKHKHTSVTAYADDVALYITSPDDMPKLCDVLGTYESATGAKINKGKSRILAFVNWDT
jgi:hypothetical protein